MRSFLRTSPRVRRGIVLVLAADAVVGLSFGVLCVGDGLSLHVPILLSLLVFAGGSQFAAVGVVANGGSAAAAVAAGLLLNTRLLPYGVALVDVLDGPVWRRGLAAQVVTDESTAFALQPAPPAERRAAFWLCGMGLYVAWNLSVAVGALAGAAIGNATALGLDAAFPAVLLALVLPTLRTWSIRRQAAAGAAVAVATTPFVPAGLPVLLGLAGAAMRRSPAGGSPCR